MTTDRVRYVAGIDVGLFSVGLAAVAIDSRGTPVEILSTVSQIHDSGLDPNEIKDAITRLGKSGVCRRTRRLFRRKRRRLIRLDTFLKNLGWPVTPLESFSDPFIPWRVRAELATTLIDDDRERHQKLSIALRHIARHRGWRNPYSKATSLLQPKPPSAAFESLREEISSTTGHPMPRTATVGQLVSAVHLVSRRLRGADGLLSERFQQSDYAREIHEICSRQGIDEQTERKLIEHVFEAESPKGSGSERVGCDPLQPGEKRALKASDAFQRYRIAALIGNLRIRETQDERSLTVDEFTTVNNYLLNLSPKKETTWMGVAELLGIDRGQLSGTAKITDDGERAGAKPPVHETNRRILNSSVKPLSAWWKGATAQERAVMLKALSNGEMDDFDSLAGRKVQGFFQALSSEDELKLDSLYLPVGRAAYSEDTLQRLTSRMLAEGVDLYTARRAEFSIPEDWIPPAPAIGEPVGNPAVDRVLKIVARWLEGATRVWGAPEKVVIEHVRSGFISENKSRKIDSDNKRRAERNLELFAQMKANLNIEGRPRRADLWRYQSIQRQNGQCAYCGSPISYHNSEMDHIVPRAGEGSTNTRSNLLAVCHRCNSSKSNKAFAAWARTSPIPGVSLDEAIERTRHWNTDPGLKKSDFGRFVSEVRDRLRRTSYDEPIDARSLESVSWMANELRARIHQRYSSDSTTVQVYRGQLTAEARKASGISGCLRFIDGVGKSRLDRRHHAVDAAVITMTTSTVAEVLATRTNLRFSQQFSNQAPSWKNFRGSNALQRTQYSQWIARMEALGELLQHALDQDRIVVTQNIRLRLDNGSLHEAKIRKLSSKRVGDAFSLQDIDRASSEALWCALTRQPDFHPVTGLPESSTRVIRIRDRHLSADDEVNIFPVQAGALAVRGGYVKLGAGVHHMRIYRIPGRKPTYAMLRVYAIDLGKRREEDLFAADLTPQSMSMRQADKKLRRALAEGTAEYLSWLVVDDELLVDLTAFNTQPLTKTQEEFGSITRWEVAGSEGESTLRLRPRQISSEGLEHDVHDSVKKIVGPRGWRIAVNKLFSFGNVTVIRRDALGRPRLVSQAHLPITWRVK